MYVRFITVSNDRHRETHRHDLKKTLAVGASSDAFTRIAFGGQTREGRSGIVLDIFNSKISGHKIDAIPEGSCDLVAHFSFSEARKGLQTLAEGNAVLIGNTTHGLLARWTESKLEVFGVGEDSENPLS